MTQSVIDRINDSIRYTNYTAFRVRTPVGFAASVGEELAAWAATLADRDITLRGVYDLRTFRGDADVLLWLHAPTAELIQEAHREFRRLEFGRHCEPTWSGMGLHRPAEFNRSHVPGFMLGKPAAEWLCVYPFVRSYEWYLLPEAERRAMLVEHGQAGHVYGGIISSTVASFALGDYEWLLALESSELHDLVDMMRDLRYTEARRHVREEVPFFTGRRCDISELGRIYS
ncbi:MAG TPA: hydrogen peroxide-dependent heme synthase [Microbacteriaceae bacterium]|nr:hydrogen peroxide-dependent heme synthase [Microbacteriaceae bacterium]